MNSNQSMKFSEVGTALRAVRSAVQFCRLGGATLRACGALGDHSLPILALCMAAQWAAASALVDPASPTNSGPKGAELVFSDEFDGPDLNAARWDPGLNPKNILYEKLTCAYRRENIGFTNGTMVFTARYEPAGFKSHTNEGLHQYHYSSGAVNTEKTFQLRQNMYVEARIKLPLNDGGFCTFWSMPNRSGDSSFADPTEMAQINFFEFIAAERKRRFSSSLWFNDYLESEIPSTLNKADSVMVGKNHYIITNKNRKGNWGSDTSILPMFQWYEWYEWNDFITVGFMATPEKMEWFVAEEGAAWETPPYLSYSGAKVRSVDHMLPDKDEAEGDVWRREVPRVLENSLILNYSVRDGDWVGGPIRNDQLPARMEIDYIRVYRLPEPAVKPR
jgi:beta-glucanase (GH16 family)